MEKTGPAPCAIEMKTNVFSRHAKEGAMSLKRREEKGGGKEVEDDED